MKGTVNQFQENEKCQKDNDEQVLKDKEVAYYSALVNAWVTTKMERDRTILVLSSGGIGVLITLLSTKGVNNQAEILLYGAAFLLFFISVLSVVIILDRNSKYIEKALNTKKNVSDSKLKRLDSLTSNSFFLGAILTFILAMSLASNELKINNKEIIMSDSSKFSKTIISDFTRSLNNITRLSPENSGRGNSDDSTSKEQTSNSDKESSGNSEDSNKDSK